jgi:hypothetical protein
LRWVFLVCGLVANPSDAVEPAVHSGGDEALVAEDLEALELLLGIRGMPNCTNARAVSASPNCRHLTIAVLGSV